jgi:putative hemolysin
MQEDIIIWQESFVISETEKLIDLGHHINGPVKSKLYELVETPCERFLCLDTLNKAYMKVVSQRKGNNIFNNWLELMNIRVNIPKDDMNKIPAVGPLIIVANHPFGGLDGVILNSILTKKRQDVKILGNYLLQHVPAIRDLIIPVDPFRKKGSAIRNLKPLKEAIRWLKQGGALQVFPAGEVSHYNIHEGGVTDPRWNHHIASIIRHTSAEVIPVFFDGRNSILFQCLGIIHPLLRTLMLPRELMNKKESIVSVQIGRRIPFNQMAYFKTDRAMIDFLRLKTYILKKRTTKHYSKFFTVPVPLPFKKEECVKLISAIPPYKQQQEVEALPARQRLLSKRNLSVYIAYASQIPQVLLEIGRLREKTFRSVGEGTGKACDIDWFDQHYLHLFIWDHYAREIAGSYRLGLTDKILTRFGIKGLYTSTLFKFKNEFLTNFKSSIELGRSFVSTPYQKKFYALSMLWQGIFKFIINNPHYHILFGPVSISNDYHTISKNIIVKFLQDSKVDPELSRYVKAKHPTRYSKIKELENCSFHSSLPTLEHVTALVSELEKDGKGIPVLLRHYLKLNGTILSFNIDKHFSRAIDSLLVVDLKKTDSKLLKHFMGLEGYAKFLEYHSTNAHKSPQNNLNQIVFSLQ